MLERNASIYKKFENKSAKSSSIFDSPVTSQTPSDFVKPFYILDSVRDPTRVNLDEYIKLKKKIHDLKRFAYFQTNEFYLGSVRDFEKRKARKTIIILSCIFGLGALLLTAVFGTLMGQLRINMENLSERMIKHNTDFVASLNETSHFECLPMTTTSTTTISTPKIIVTTPAISQPVIFNQQD